MISKLIFYFLLLLFPFGQLTRLPIGDSEIGVYAHDTVLLLLIFAFFLEKIFKKEKLKFPKASRAILIFALSGFLSLAFNLGKWQQKALFVGFLYFLRWVAYAFLYFYVYDLVKKDKKQKDNILQLLVLASIAAVVFGLGQYIFIPDIGPLRYLGWDPHYYRLVGSYLDPGFTGLIYVLAIVLLLTCPSLYQLPITHYLLPITLYIALSLTYSRSAYLAYLAAMAAVAWHKKSAKFFLIVLIVGILTVVLLPRPGGEGVRLERKSTLLARIETCQNGLTIFYDNPLFGVGFNTLRYAQKKYGFLDSGWQETHSGAGIDNSFIFILATTGLVGFTSYLFLLKKLAAIGRVGLISLICVTVHSLFNNSFFYPWVMLWLWIVLGLNEA